MDDAYALAGKKTEKQILIENSEQYDARRELLSVEALANQKREQEVLTEQAYIEKVKQTLHKQITLDLDKKLTDIDDIINSVLHIDVGAGSLLDILYTEACSISRLVASIEKMPWLTKSVINFCRQPKYRRTDSKGHPIIIKSLRPAVSFLGIESLRVLIPVLIAKHMMPSASESFPGLNKFLWMYTMGSGNVARALASDFGVRQEFGYILGLFAIIGRTAVVSSYLKSFDLKLKEAVIKSRQENDVEKAKALANLVPSQDYLAAYTSKYAKKVSYRVVSKLNMRWVMISPGYEDLTKVQHSSFRELQRQDLHPTALLLFKAQGYVQFKMLQAQKLINREESMLFLRNAGITGEDISSLATLNLTGLKLRIAGNIAQD